MQGQRPHAAPDPFFLGHTICTFNRVSFYGGVFIKHWAATRVPSVRISFAMVCARVITCSRAFVSDPTVGAAGVCAVPDAKLLDPGCPVMLVVMLRDDNLRCATSRGGMRGPCTTMVDDGSNLFKQRLMVDLTDGNTIRFVVHECQVRPAAKENCATSKCAGRLDHYAVEVFRRVDAAEAEVDGWIAGVEEHLQLMGQWTIIFQDPRTGLENGLVHGIGLGSQCRVGRQPRLAGQDIAAHSADGAQTKLCPMRVEDIPPLAIPTLRILFP